MPADDPGTPDSDLVEASRRGDLEAFNRLVERYQGQVYNLVLRMLHDPAAAEDLCQEAFLSAYQSMRSFRGGSFRAWLFRIAVNSCYDTLRRSKRRPATSLEALLEGRETPQDLPDPAIGPEGLVLRREQQQVLAALFQDLPPDQRAVVLLADVQGLSYEEIAHATGEAIGTVKSRLSRGRARLKDLLKHHGELFPLVQRLSREQA